MFGYLTILIQIKLFNHCLSVLKKHSKTRSAPSRSFFLLLLLPSKDVIVATYSSSSVKFSPNSLATFFKFLNDIFPVFSSSNNLNALLISSNGSLERINSSAVHSSPHTLSVPLHFNTSKRERGVLPILMNGSNPMTNCPPPPVSPPF